MLPDKPCLFIGSSQEARDAKVVSTFIDILKEDAHCIPWWQDPRFKEDGSNTTFAALARAATDYDFAIFIFTGDDKLESRKKQFVAPRDNVVFEFGLFLGAIGPDRVMAYVCKQKHEMRIASDFSGVSMPRFEHDGQTQKSVASVQAACNGFCTTIRKQSFRKIDLPITKTWGFDTKKREFVVNLCAARLTRARSTIGNFGVCIAARIEDPEVNIEDDVNITYTSIRKLPETVNDNVRFRIAETKFKRAPRSGDTIEARVVLVPDTLEFDDKCPLAVAVQARCRIVETMSFRLGAVHKRKTVSSRKPAQKRKRRSVRST
jgi:hypothetical protein